MVCGNAANETIFPRGFYFSVCNRLGVLEQRRRSGHISELLSIQKKAKFLIDFIDFPETQHNCLLHQKTVVARLPPNIYLDDLLPCIGPGLDLNVVRFLELPHPPPVVALRPRPEECITPLSIQIIKRWPVSRTRRECVEFRLHGLDPGRFFLL